MTTQLVATHHTCKDEQGQITHYDLKVADALVGTVTKGEKGKFSFQPHDGAGSELTDIGTMRDLKIEVLRNLPKSFVEAHAPTPKPKKEKKASKKEKGDQAEHEQAVTAAPDASSEDINLD